MTTTLDLIFSDIDSRIAHTRDLAIMNFKAGGSGGSLSPAAAGMFSAAAPFGSEAFGDQASSSAARQYAASMTDTPATAIRPVAVKIADQVVRAGTKRLPNVPNPGMMKKSASDFLLLRAPAAIRNKAISEGITTVETHPFLEAIANPNPLFSQWALMFCTAWSIEATGEAVWILDPATDEFGNPAIRIWYWPRHWVVPVHDENRAFRAWKLMPPGASGDIPLIPAELVCHFFYPDPSNPLRAFSPVQSQAKSINVESKIRDAHLAAMNNAIEPGLMLIAGNMDNPPSGQTGNSPRMVLTPEQRKQLIEAVKLVYRGVQNWGDPLILDGLIEDAKPYRSSGKDLDLQHGYKLSRDGIMQGIGTNPIMAGLVEGVNRATSYTAQDNFYSIKANPVITMMSQVMTRTFGRLEMMRPSRRNSTLVLWIEEAKPHDAELKLREMAFLAGKNWLRPSEAREAFDLPPEPELDDEWEERRKNPPIPPAPPGQTPQANSDGDGDDDKIGSDERIVGRTRRRPGRPRSDEYVETASFDPSDAKNCGIASGGFQPGNECARGGGSGKSAPPQKMREATKSEIAKASAVRVDKVIQRYSEEHNEPILSKGIGGKHLADNEPVDATVKIGGKMHGVELKTVTIGKNKKLTMDKDAMGRKSQWERSNKGIVHTVVFEDSKVYNAKGPGKHDPSKRKIFYRRGYGSFRVGAMMEVKDMAHLKAIMAMKLDKLPKSAGGKLPNPKG